MQRSSRILSLKDADCLLHLPRQAGTLPKGTAGKCSLCINLRGVLFESKPLFSVQIAFLKISIFQYISQAYPLPYVAYYATPSH